MRFTKSLVFVASLLAFQMGSLCADVKQEKQHTLEGVLKVHPKYLYKYYIAFGNGQTCALYSSKHNREDASLSAIKPGTRIKVRGVLGTEFHRSTNTKANPSPFDSAWILFMNVEAAGLVGSQKSTRPRSTGVKVGMTFQEVINAKGRHYRPSVGARTGSVLLVYDDICVEIFNDLPNSPLKGRVRYIHKTNLVNAAEHLKNIPYADAKTSKHRKQ